MKKKLLAGLLTVCMLVSLAPGMVYAEPAGKGNVQEEVSIEAVEEEKNITQVMETSSEDIITADEAGEYHQVALEIPLIDSDTEIDVPAYYSSVALMEYDNSSIMPDVRNQNPWGTCWTFASMAAAEGSLIAGKKQVDGSTVDANIDLSEYQLAYFQYHSVADPLGNTTGDATIGQNIWSDEGGDLVDTEGWYNYLNLGGNMMFATWVMAAWQAGADETTAPYDSISENGLDSSVASQNKVHLENAYWIPMTQKEYVK